MHLSQLTVSDFSARTACSTLYSASVPRRAVADIISTSNFRPSKISNYAFYKKIYRELFIFKWAKLSEKKLSGSKKPLLHNLFKQLRFKRNALLFRKNAGYHWIQRLKIHKNMLYSYLFLDF